MNNQTKIHGQSTLSHPASILTPIPSLLRKEGSAHDLESHIFKNFSVLERDTVVKIPNSPSHYDRICVKRSGLLSRT